MALEKSVRVGGLPHGTQEAILQQAFAKVAPVSRVSITERSNEALIELESEEVRAPCAKSNSRPSRADPASPSSLFPPPLRPSARSS